MQGSKSHKHSVGPTWECSQVLPFSAIPATVAMYYIHVAQERNLRPVPNHHMVFQISAFQFNVGMLL